MADLSEEVGGKQQAKGCDERALSVPAAPAFEGTLKRRYVFACCVACCTILWVGLTQRKSCCVACYTILWIGLYLLAALLVIPFCNQRGGLMQWKKPLSLSAGRSRVQILDRGKCSLRTIAVDAKINYPSYLFIPFCGGD